MPGQTILKPRAIAEVDKEIHRGLISTAGRIAMRLGRSIWKEKKMDFWLLLLPEIQLSLFKNPPFVCGSHSLASSCISSQKADVDSAFLLTLPVSSVQASAAMASPECETTMGETGVNTHDESAMLSYFLFIYFLSHMGQNGSVFVSDVDVM